MNSFESLCSLASKEDWCWKLYCTTCGTSDLRYSLMEIGKGKSPDEDGWSVHKNTRLSSSTHAMLTDGFSEDIKEKVLGICLNADISRIARNCKFPDWLGYLGFVLEHLHTKNTIYNKVSKNWAKQLLNMVPKDGASYEMLVDTVENDSVLLVKDLEIIENDYLKLQGNH